MPRSISSVSRGATSAYSQGDQSEDYSESFSAGLSFLQHIWRFQTSFLDPKTGGVQHLVRWASGRQDVDRCIGGRAKLPESDPELTAMLSQASRERQAALEASSFSRTLQARRLVPGGAGRSTSAASGSILPRSA